MCAMRIKENVLAELETKGERRAKRTVLHSKSRPISGLLKEVERLASDYGLPVEKVLDLLHEAHHLKSLSKRSRQVYRHPEDVSKVWHGVGRQPKWIAELIEQGWDIEDLRK